jgi:broad specificity phosphatase PhoE
VPRSSRPTLLTLVRHGETSANVDGVWHGSIDTALTARGRRQAELVARHLAATRGDARALYASPLARARDTAAAIARALRLELALEEHLREYHLGDWEGRTYRELAATERLFERMQADPDWTPGGGESARQVAERFAGALARIAARHPGERVVVVGHGGALTLALGLLLDGDCAAWRRVMDNCAVSDLVLEPPELVVFNEVGHLHELAEPA